METASLFAKAFAFAICIMVTVAAVFWVGLWLVELVAIHLPWPDFVRGRP